MFILLDNSVVCIRHSLIAREYTLHANNLIPIRNDSLLIVWRKVGESLSEADHQVICKFVYDAVNTWQVGEIIGPYMIRPDNNDSNSKHVTQKTVTAYPWA